MVTSVKSLEKVEDVFKFFPKGEVPQHIVQDEEEIRSGHVCECDEQSLDYPLYKADKTAIGVCKNCEGYFSYVLTRGNHI